MMLGTIKTCGRLYISAKSLPAKEESSLTIISGKSFVSFHLGIYISNTSFSYSEIYCPAL